MESPPCAKRGEPDPRSATRKSRRSPNKLLTVRDVPISLSPPHARSRSSFRASPTSRSSSPLSTCASHAKPGFPAQNDRISLGLLTIGLWQQEGLDQGRIDRGGEEAGDESDQRFASAWRISSSSIPSSNGFTSTAAAPSWRA